MQVTQGFLYLKFTSPTSKHDKDVNNLEVNSNQLLRLYYTRFKGHLGLIQTHPILRQYVPH